MVQDFALKLQSRALTLLLNVPFEESETWISWGTHVFRSEGEALDGKKAAVLYDYIDDQIEKASQNPGEDIYSVLLAMEHQGRKLTKEEVKGVMVLTFAGGRDTVINAVTNSIAYLAEHPEHLGRLRNEPEIIGKAVEELVRYFAPLTHMGRVVSEGTELCSHAVEADTRVSLCWASANRDAGTFENPNEVVLDRKINPHVSFRFQPPQLPGCHPRPADFEATPHPPTPKGKIVWISRGTRRISEEWGDFKRKVGFHRIEVAFNS